jgi:hypothetical protein
MAQTLNSLVDRTSLPRAQSNLTKEESQIQAEINAFEDFLDRLNEKRPQPYRADGGTQAEIFRSQISSSPTPQEVIQSAYRETVLAVDHWEDAYGKETAFESMANEFGDDVAVGLTGGSATWSLLLWKQLQDASKEAIKTRQSTYQMVIKERQLLEDLQHFLAEIGDELARIERAEYSFSDRSNRLAMIQERLEQVADEQQKYLRQRETSKKNLFSALVYADLESSHPGLAAIATTREVRDRIEVHHWSGMI